jgi:hypothetical protein
VVSHDPDQFRAQFRGSRFDLTAQPTVRIDFGNVGKVAGEDECVNLLVPSPKAVKNTREIARDVDSRKEFAIPAEQVGVRDMGDGV